MKIEKVWVVCYSATGMTKRAAETVGKTLAETLDVSFESVSFCTPQERSLPRIFGREDLVVLGSPTYAGRVPNKIAPSFSENLQGHDTPAVALVTYGNRSYDNALAELCAILGRNGFRTVGGVACVARHAFSDKVAVGRPDVQDIRELVKFAAHTGERLRCAKDLPHPVRVSGDAGAPYYVPKDETGNPVNFLRARPKTDPEKCDGCGLCAGLCPMGSIEKEPGFEAQGICIKCQACVRGCPQGAKYFDDVAYIAHVAMLEKYCTEPKKNAIFYGDFDCQGPGQD